MSPGFDDTFVKVPVSELKFWHTSNQLLLILLSQPRPRTSANLLHHLSIVAKLFAGVCSGIEDNWSGGSFFAKFLASLGLFINDVIIFGDYPRFSPQSTLYTLNT